MQLKQKITLAGGLSKMTLTKLIIYFVILLTPIGYALAIEMYPPKTTVCEMSKAKSDYLNKIIQVNGLYETDMRHGALLSDPNCPEKAFRIGYYINEDEPSIVKFEQDQGVRYTKLNEVRRMQVTLVGKLVRYENEETQSDIQRRKFKFHIIKIINYKFLPKKESGVN